MHFVPALPKRVTLELTNRCNRRCDGCPRHRMVYPLGDMAITLLTNVTDQLPDDVTIVPFMRGEPCLHPRFVEAMRVLRKFTTVQLATNADFLTPHNETAILNTCTFVSVSLHDDHPNGLQTLTPFFRAARRHGVTTQLSHVGPLSPWTVKTVLEVVDRVRVYKPHSDDGFGSMDGEPPTTMPCHKPFEEMVIYWDGKVGLCNHDWNNLTPLGDVATRSLADVWTGKPYQKVRRLHMQGKRRAVASCNRCDFKPHHVYGEVYVNG